MAKVQNRHLEKFDFLRGIAILMVFGVHGWFAIFYPLNPLIYNNFFVDFSTNSFRDLVAYLFPVSLGWTGVELFLILSGFLIHYGYLINTANKEFSLKVYFNKRFWRIYPPYLITLLYFSFAAGINTDVKGFVYHLLMVHNFDDMANSQINSSYWSLALECQLYMVYPIFLFARKKIGLNATIAVIGVIALISSIISIVYEIHNSALIASVLRYWIIWVAGAYLAECYVNGRRLTNFGWKRVAGLLLFILVLTPTTLCKYLATYYFSAFYIVFIEWFLYVDIRSMCASKVASLIYKFVVLSGLCSYSMYLIHKPLLDSWVNYFTVFGISTDSAEGKVLSVVVIFFILFLISYSLYLFVERKSIQIGKQFYRIYLS